MTMKLVIDNTRHVKRIGDPGVVWATCYAGDRWTVYGYQSGLIVRNVTQAQAERVIENFEKARTTHPSTGAAT